MHRLICALIVAFLVPVPALAASGAAPGFRLGAGDAALWNGPVVASSSGTETFEYVLEVEEPALRLRIGIDHPEVGDTFAVDVEDPTGDATGFSVGPGIYSEERLFYHPKPGLWRITVTAQSVTESAFRMRAKLEAKMPSVGTRKGAVLPNLQILPPHDASFLIPVTNGAGDQDPVGVDAAGLGGCHPEEHIEDGATRCLRFGFGVRNTGLGPMDLYHTGSDPDVHDLFQRIHRADGSMFDRAAGRAVLHKSHGHFHHDAAAGVHLFRVVDPADGTLEEAGAPRTKGFAHRNELLREWNVFYPTELPLTGFGLLPGWADIYEWDRPGNYIDFALNTDGLYVVRMSADPVDGIKESNERDNWAYTYLEVTGSAVELIESGRGRDPWDPCKIVVGFGGHPDPKQKSQRPRSCPPDTV
ncbi:MAG TPA: hypothetical protein VNC78_07215 [Actinomycetota bacterium]|nr:hypothetical protein [Actinomycetota bacterium]